MDQNEVLKDNSAVRDEKNRIRKAQRQSKLLDVKKLMKDPFTLTVILLITLFLLLFVVYPLLNLFVGAFSKSVKVGTVDGIAVREDQFSFENFTYIFSKIYFGDAIKNSMIIGLIVALPLTTLCLSYYKRFILMDEDLASPSLPEQSGEKGKA